jgi:hypothetical protein
MDEHNNAQPKRTKMRSTYAQNKQEHNVVKKKKKTKQNEKCIVAT